MLLTGSGKKEGLAFVPPDIKIREYIPEILLQRVFVNNLLVCQS